MLNETVIARAKPRAAAYQMTEGRGMFLLVTPAGGKLWRYKYRYGGTQKQMGLGKYPDVPLSRARSLHEAARRLLATGVDPMTERKAQKLAAATSDSRSFASVAALWLDHWSLGTTPRHADTTRRRLEANTLPLLGARPVDAIQAPEIVRMVKAIQARGVTDLAKRSLETVGQIFRYAVAHGHATRNPAADIKPADVLRPTRKANYARVDARELPALLRAIEVYRGHVVTRLAMKLMVLCFPRTGELIGARWSEINFAAGRWDIPAARMKARRPHLIPLSTQALEVLTLLKSVTGSGDLLFPGERDPSKPMSNNTILFALRRMGYGGRMTGHGFRGLASTLLHEQGFPHEHIELQLAHTRRDAVSAAYNHALYLSGRSKMLQAWADYLERSLRGGGGN